MAITPYTPRPETSDAQRHAEGLRTVAALLTDPAAHAHLVRLREQGRLDPALAQHASQLAHVRSSTTVRLEMSDQEASTLLSILITSLDRAWSMVGMECLPSEDDLGGIGDHAAAIVAVAHALNQPAFDQRWRARLARPLEDEQARTGARTYPAKRGMRPATLERLERLLAAEFADDPEDLDVLVGMARALEQPSPVVAESAEPAPVPAPPAGNATPMPAAPRGMVGGETVIPADETELMLRLTERQVHTILAALSAAQHDHQRRSAEAMSETQCGDMAELVRATADLWAARERATLEWWARARGLRDAPAPMATPTGQRARADEHAR